MFCFSMDPSSVQSVLTPRHQGRGEDEDQHRKGMMIVMLDCPALRFGFVVLARQKRSERSWSRPQEEIQHKARKRKGPSLSLDGFQPRQDRHGSATSVMTENSQEQVSRRGPRCRSISVARPTAEQTPPRARRPVPTPPGSARNQPIPPIFGG